MKLNQAPACAVVLALAAGSATTDAFLLTPAQRAISCTSHAILGQEQHVSHISRAGIASAFAPHGCGCRCPACGVATARGTTWRGTANCRRMGIVVSHATEGEAEVKGSVSVGAKAEFGLDDETLDVSLPSTVSSY